MTDTEVDRGTVPASEDQFDTFGRSASYSPNDADPEKASGKPVVTNYTQYDNTLRSQMGGANAPGGRTASVTPKPDFIGAKHVYGSPTEEKGRMERLRSWFREHPWTHRDWWTRKRKLLAAIIIALLVFFLVILPIIIVFTSRGNEEPTVPSRVAFDTGLKPLLNFTNETDIWTTFVTDPTTWMTPKPEPEPTTEVTAQMEDFFTDYPFASNVTTDYNTTDSNNTDVLGTDWLTSVDVSTTMALTTTGEEMESTIVANSTEPNTLIRIPKPPPVANCSAHGFVCLNNPNSRIGSNQVCDGINDCADGSDESECYECRTVFSCPIDFLRNSTLLKCLRGSALCNKETDCPNSEDESDLLCNRDVCSPEEYRCRAGAVVVSGGPTCIPSEWLCDGDAHCPLGDDEDDLGCTQNMCKNGAKWCSADKRCIPVWDWCEGTPHCSDASDEANCSCSECSGDGSVLCSHSEGRCIARNQICNGEADCPNGEDEIHCPGYCKPDAATALPRLQCMDGKEYPQRVACSGLVEACQNGVCRECDSELAFQCQDTSKRCIPRRHLCDHYPHCGDGSDESPQLCNCTGAVSVKEMSTDDDSARFRCPDNVPADNQPKCLPARFRCDGYHDCQDGSDEKDCDSCWNNIGAIHCATTRICYPSSSRCDGVIDCPDYSDEDHCSCDACKSHMYRTFLCSENQRCLKAEFVCNSQSKYHCPGAAPEDEQFCQPDFDFLNPQNYLNSP